MDSVMVQEMMPVTVHVSPDTYRVAQLLVKLVKDLKVAAADGIQLSDLATIAGAVLADLMPALADIDKLPAEAKANLIPFITAINLSALDLVKELIG